MKPKHIPKLYASADPKAMWDKVEADRHARMRTFNEVMTGPNPLTPEECDRMAAKRPEYAFMAAFGAAKAI